MKKFVYVLFPIAIFAVVLYAMTIHGQANGSNISETSSTKDKYFTEDEYTIDRDSPSTEPSFTPSSLDSENAIDLDPNSFTVLVNNEYTLSPDYKPADLAVPDVAFAFHNYDPKMMMRVEAANALENLFNAALKKNLELIGVSGYRSYERQFEIYALNLIKKGIEQTNLYSAMAGASEHQTGLAMDVSCPSIGNKLDDSFFDTAEGQWLAAHCYEYGFIIRYPQGSTHITGYSYEPWHIRYVGIELATYLTQNNLTLDEYYGYQANDKIAADVDYDAIIEEYYAMKHITSSSQIVTSDSDSDNMEIVDVTDEVITDSSNADSNSSNNEKPTSAPSASDKNQASSNKNDTSSNNTNKLPSSNNTSSNNTNSNSSSNNNNSNHNSGTSSGNNNTTTDTPANDSNSSSNDTSTDTNGGTEDTLKPSIPDTETDSEDSTTPTPTPAPESTVTPGGEDLSTDPNITIPAQQNDIN